MHGSEPVAFIEVPGLVLWDDINPPNGDSFFVGELDRRLDWLVETPTQICTKDGRVTAVATGHRGV